MPAKISVNGLSPTITEAFGSISTDFKYSLITFGFGLFALPITLQGAILEAFSIYSSFLLLEIIATSKSFKKELNHSTVSGKKSADLDTITVLSKSNIIHFMPCCLSSSKFIS